MINAMSFLGGSIAVSFISMFFTDTIDFDCQILTGMLIAILYITGDLR